MLYITGDLHATLDLHKLDKLFKIETKNDYIIICGDFGMCWTDINQTMLYYFQTYHKATILFVDGNHENHNMLDHLPTKQMFGDEVGVVADKIYHLKRGRIYTIENKTFFTFGGAMSIDKQCRIEGISWWSRELPSNAEFELGLKNLATVNNKVDYIITHDCPNKIAQEIYADVPAYEKFDAYCLTKYFNKIAEEVQFKGWYFGHHHTDTDYGKDLEFHAMYNDILLIATD